ncbi:MAG: methylated-DNA--[protein]-cysteine S-methyltransferase [Erysipelotrichales bacterium]|nr:methylated-DNA--[protein]-cysteine S-methyltransferase [Erysipelotrichales bacterium]
MLYKTRYESPIGELTLLSDGNSLIEIRLYKSRYPSIASNLKTVECDDLNVFKLTKTWLDKYFSCEIPDIKDLPLKFIGSEFQQKVMSLLCEIPYGTVTTYKDIARKINPKMSAQAVGNAVGRNPLAIIVPCHRVIGVNNNLVGFGGGLEVKKYLLNHEGVDVSKLKTPTKGNAL